MSRILITLLATGALALLAACGDDNGTGPTPELEPLIHGYVYFESEGIEGKLGGASIVCYCHTCSKIEIGKTLSNYDGDYELKCLGPETHTGHKIELLTTCGNSSSGYRGQAIIDKASPPPFKYNIKVERY